jgi:hypothetical protein
MTGPARLVRLVSAALGAIAPARITAAVVAAVQIGGAAIVHAGGPNTVFDPPTTY